MFPTPLSSGPLGQGNLFEDLLLLWVEGLAVVEVFVGRRKFCIMRRLHLLILLLVLPPDASGAGCKDVLDKVRGIAWSSRFHLGSGLDFNLSFLWLSLPSLSGGTRDLAAKLGCPHLPYL